MEITMREIDLKVRDDVREYMSRALDRDDWNRRCANVKADNNGAYPDFWYEAIVTSGLIAETKAGWPLQLSDDELTVRALNEQ